MSDPADGLQIFGFLSDGLDSALDKFVMTSVNQLMSYLSPVVEAGLAIYIVYYGYLVMSGKIETPFQDAMLKMVKIVFIATIATVPGNYYTYVYGFMQDFQNLLVHALNNFGGNVAGSDTVVQVLDQQFSAGMLLVSQAAEHISIHSLSWIFVTAAIAVTITALFFVAAGLVFLCEIGIAIVAALGPLFVLCLLFPPLANYFDKWLSTFVTLIITTVIAMVSTVVCMRFFQGIVEPANFAAPIDNPMMTSLQIMIAGFVMMFLLKQVPHIANSLAGGVGLHGMELSTMLSPAKQTYRQVVKPLGNKIEKFRDERAQYSAGKNSIEPDLPVSPRLTGYGGAAGSYRNIGAFGTYSGNESADGFDLGSKNKLPSIEPSPDDSPRVAAYKRDVADWKTSDAPFAQSIVRAAPDYIRDLQLQEQQEAATSSSVNTAANDRRFDINEGFETERAVASVDTASDSSVDSNANNAVGDDSGNNGSNDSSNGDQS
jgi:type IV secretion system protein VirB6